METDQGKKAPEYTEYIAQVESNGSTQATERALVRKIDLFLLPTIWLMYLLSYIDRTKSVLHAVIHTKSPIDKCSIGNAKIAGMQADLHLSSGQYSISLIVFFISYVLFEVPSKYWVSVPW